jgi:very-short-patch-repair endonuclease
MIDRKRPLPSKHMIGRSRQLRQEMTIPERLLWGKLRSHRLAGLQFRRQHPIGPYVVDFYCPTAKLVIEIDGRSHCGQEIPDRQRQEFLEQHGLRVIRFSNDRVINHLTDVVRAIAEVCQAALSEENPG